MAINDIQISRVRRAYCANISRRKWRYSFLIIGMFSLLLLVSLLLKQPDYEGQFIDLRLAPLPIMLQPDANFCGKLNFLVALHSSADDFSTRQLWRDTYGRFSRKYSFNILFALGRYSGANTTIQSNIEKEASKFGDILQSEFTDSYRNLTLKQISLLRYFHDNCEDGTVLLKLDDDVAWNVNEAAKYISSFKKDDNSVIYCNVMRENPIVRDPQSRWYISKYEYGFSRYVSYCSGMVYFVNRPTVGKMLHALKISNFFWVDDAYVTGIVRRDAKVAQAMINGIVNPGKQSWKTDMKKYIFQQVPENDVRTAFQIYNNEHRITN